MIDEFLDDPDFADSVADLLSRAFRNRADIYTEPNEEDDGGAPASYQQSVAEESTMLIRHIVRNNCPMMSFFKRIIPSPMRLRFGMGNDWLRCRRRGLAAG